MTQKYIGGFGLETARIMLVGQAPDEEEERSGHAFAAKSGRDLTKFLEQAKFNFQETYRTNVLRFKPPRNYTGGQDLSQYWETSKKKGIEAKLTYYRGAYVSETLLNHLDDLRKEIEIVKPNVIIALGNLAMWALTGETGIDAWRGSEMELVFPNCAWKCKVVPTFNPAYINQVPSSHMLIRRDIRRAVENADSPEIVKPTRNFIIRPSFDQACNALSTLITQLSFGPVELGVDIETKRGQIECVGIAVDTVNAICIPIQSKERRDGYWSLEEELEIVRRLRSVLSHPNARIVGHNFHYDDFYFCTLWGFACNVSHDTMITWHVLFARMEKSLSFVCSILSDHYLYWKDDGKETDEGISEEQRWTYCCTDVVRTLEAKALIVQYLEKLKLTEQAAFEMSLYPVVRKMMLRGVKRDTVMRDRLSRELDLEVKARFSWLESVFGHPVNPNSPKQLKDLFYGDLAQKVIFDRKTRKPVFNDNALTRIAEREPLLSPVVSVVSQTRSLRVFKSTFTDAPTDHDGRIRTHFWIPGTSTYRFSSKTNPFGTGANLQNIPKGTGSRALEILQEHGGAADIGELAALVGVGLDVLEETLEKFRESGYVSIDRVGRVMLRFFLPNIRRLFVPDNEHILITGDLERADFQVVVWESGDVALKQMLREGVDVHTEVAKVVKLTRQQTKQLIHATDYFAQIKKIAEALGITVHHASQAQSRLFSAFPGIYAYQERIRNAMATNGYVENAFGFRCYFFEPPESMLPEAAAWIPQSTVAIVINKGIEKVDREMREVQTLLQVHDEGVFQVHKSLFPSIMPEIDKRMRVTIPYEDPLIIPLDYKYSEQSWGDLNKYKAAQ